MAVYFIFSPEGLGEPYSIRRIAGTVEPIILLTLYMLFIRRKLVYDQKQYYKSFKMVLLDKGLLLRVLEQPGKLNTVNVPIAQSLFEKRGPGKQDICFQKMYYQLLRNFGPTSELYGVNAGFENSNLVVQVNLILIVVGVCPLLVYLMNVFPGAHFFWMTHLYYIIITTVMFCHVPNSARHAGLRLAICDAFLE